MLIVAVVITFPAEGTNQDLSLQIGFPFDSLKRAHLNMIFSLKIP